MDDPLVLDANAVAGDLAELFGFEVTVAVGRCAHCGNVAAVGALLAWTHGPGVTLRCSICREVVIRYVRAGSRTYLDLRGAAYLLVRR
jgi:propanediol dehydratase large subunit